MIALRTVVSWAIVQYDKKTSKVTLCGSYETRKEARRRKFALGYGKGFYVAKVVCKCEYWL